MQRGRRVAQIRAAILTSDREGGADEAGSGSQTRGRQCGHSLAGGICPRGVLRRSVPAIGSAEGAACSTLLTGVAHQVHSLEGLYGPYEQGRGTSAGFNNNVQAVVHPVHKVHVGVSGRPEHDSVAARPSEARVGGLVVVTSIRFEFYDPANSYARSVVSDQSGAEKRVCSRQAIAGQQVTRECVLERGGRHETEGMAQGKSATRSPGNSHASRCMTIGTTASRIAAPMCDWVISRSWTHRSWPISSGNGAGIV